MLLTLLPAAAGMYCLFSFQKNRLNTVFILLAFFWAYWHFIELGIRNCDLGAQVKLWSAVGAIRFAVIPLILHFVLLYTKKIDARRTVPVLLALYLPALPLIAVELAGSLKWYEPVRYSGGWIINRNSVIIDGLLVGWTVAVSMLCLLNVFDYWRSRPSDEKKGAFAFLALVTCCAVVAGTTFVLDFFIQMFPGLFLVNGATVMVVVSILVFRYNLKVLSPGTAAEDILTAIPDALLITTVEGRALRINPKAEQMTGYGGKDIETLHIDDFFEKGFGRSLYNRAVSSERGNWTQESILVTKGGKEIPVVVNVALVRRTGKNVPAAMVVSCHDSTFEKRALDEFRKTEQLEALGFLAGGIAHDFNNLLTSIVAYLSLARSTEELSESMKAKLDKVDSAAHMVINLNRQLATLAKGSKPNKELCSIKEVITSAIQLALSGSAIECHSVIPDDLHAIEADVTQLNQVFLNLLVNARQSMEHGGIIGVMCSNITIDGTSCVEVIITDQGCGIPPEKREDIFKPFYTTKQHGTGLGLSVVKSVVEKHGGSISVSTRRGVGTTFVVSFPAEASCVGEKSGDAVDADDVPPKKGRILVMDDEEGVKKAITMILAEKGHFVVGAAHGADAIAAYLTQRSEGTPFDLLILDVTVRNGYGAQEVIRRLREIDPDVCAIVMSGYRDNILMKEFEAYGFIDVIPKPFDSHQIYRAVNRALRSRQAESA